MNTLKIIGLGLLILVALVLILALFVPKKYTVEVSEIIDVPRHEVYDFMRMLRNQKQFSVWVMADPDLNVEIIGEDGRSGAIYKWSSTINDVGEGEMEITSLGIERMEVDLRFVRPFKNEAKATYFFNEKAPRQTEVIAAFYADNKFPINLPSYIFGRKYIKDAQKQNLQNLKKLLEN